MLIIFSNFVFLHWSYKHVSLLKVQGQMQGKTIYSHCQKAVLNTLKNKALFISFRPWLQKNCNMQLRYFITLLLNNKGSTPNLNQTLT